VPLQRNIRRRLSETVLPLDRPSICLSGLVTTSPLRLHQPSPIVFLLRVHSSRESTLVAAENFRIEPELAVEDYLDAFGNRCGRVNTPAGIIRFLSNAVVRDSGQPDAYAPEAEEDGMAEIPTDTLSFILPSRYCEVDSGLLDFAWKRFAAITPGRARVQAICDFVHSHLRFDYQMARANRTAVDAFKERVGVCRDFTHLAITLCRCLNIPARYVTGYLGDIGVPPLPDPLCDDRGQPSNAAVSWTLVNPEPDRHPADFSSLVLPMGRGRHPARCSPPGDLQNILRSN
jgi:transglutaminase-like putative cysteine protease